MEAPSLSTNGVRREAKVVSKIRLLVVEDSATVRAIIEQILEQDEDCEVVGAAACVDVARELMIEKTPNLITLDLNLPGISGFDFLDELMHCPHAPVVVLSSQTCANSDVAREALGRGAYACFDKNKILAEAGRFKRLLKTTAAGHQRRMIAGTAWPKVSKRAAMPRPTELGASETTCGLRNA
jgi:chemotaxis response regulator CheB